MRKLRSSWLLVLFVVTGVILGSLIGSFFANAIPLLNYGPGPLGLNGVEVDLGIIYFKISLLLEINVSSLIGLLLGVVIFNRL